MQFLGGSCGKGNTNTHVHVFTLDESALHGNAYFC